MTSSMYCKETAGSHESIAINFNNLLMHDESYHSQFNELANSY
jgi:hypothetical protein